MTDVQTVSDTQIDVDGTYCISLAQNNDRRKNIVNAFTPICGDITFWIPEKDASNPERGCFKSHQEVARDALDKGCETILVLEDDAQLDFLPRRKIVSRVNRFISTNSFELFFIGGIVKEARPTKHRSIARCKFLCTHAYILSKAGMRHLVSVEYEGVPVDVMYLTNFRSYCSVPIFVSQTPETSSSSAIAQYAGRDSGRNERFWRSNRYRLYSDVAQSLLGAVLRK